MKAGICYFLSISIALYTGSYIGGRQWELSLSEYRIASSWFKLKLLRSGRIDDAVDALENDLIISMNAYGENNNLTRWLYPEFINDNCRVIVEAVKYLHRHGAELSDDNNIALEELENMKYIMTRFDINVQHHIECVVSE